MTYLDKREHVFVVGSPRSGTSLLASILQDSGIYASYRAENKLLADCEAKYGALHNQHSRDKFWRDWFRSRQFKRSGITRQELLNVVDEQRSYIGILGSFMHLVAAKQGCDLWVDSTPENSHHLKEIAQSFTHARVVHIIRDGRAVSLSLAKLGWSGVRTKNLKKALGYAALKWQDSVEDVFNSYSHLNGRYLEIRYEELVQEPANVISRLCGFLKIPMLDHKLLESDYSKTNQDSRSTLHTPNTPFADMSSGISSKAAFRWKSILDESQICRIEAHIGGTLSKLKYPLLCDIELPWIYNYIPAGRRKYIAAKKHVRKHTWLGRVTTSPLDLD